MAKFVPGEVVKIKLTAKINPNCDGAVIPGQEVTILRLWDYPGLTGYILEEKAPNGDHIQGPEHMLEKLPPPDEVSSWDRCLWKPDSTKSRRIALLAAARRVLTRV